MKFPAGNSTIDVNVPGAERFLAQVRQHLAAGRGFAAATLNLDHLVKLQSDPAFQAAYRRQDLIVADGRPITWLARLGGQAMTVAPGSDMILPLCRVAADLGVKVALVGSTQATLDRAADSLREAVPGLNIGLCIAPSQGFDPASAEARDILQNLGHADIGLCFLALGAPKQEKFAANAKDLALDIGFVSIGAGLDFIAGQQRRAPRWMRRLALEWLWRILDSPRRMIPRYLACFAILPRLTFWVARHRWANNQA